jgi:hypothetical protein
MDKASITCTTRGSTGDTPMDSDCHLPTSQYNIMYMQKFAGSAPAVLVVDYFCYYCSQGKNHPYAPCARIRSGSTSIPTTIFLYTPPIC